MSVAKRRVDVANFYLVNSTGIKFVSSDGNMMSESSYCLPYLSCSLVFMDSVSAPVHATERSVVSATRGYFLDCRVSSLTSMRLSVSMFSPAQMLIQCDSRFSKSKSGIVAESVAAILYGKKPRLPYPQVIVDAMLSTAASAIANAKYSEKVEYIASEVFDFNKAAEILGEMAKNAAEAHR